MFAHISSVRYDRSRGLSCLLKSSYLRVYFLKDRCRVHADRQRSNIELQRSLVWAKTKMRHVFAHFTSAISTTCRADAAVSIANSFAISGKTVQLGGSHWNTARCSNPLHFYQFPKFSLPPPQKT